MTGLDALIGQWIYATALRTGNRALHVAARHIEEQAARLRALKRAAHHTGRTK